MRYAFERASSEWSANSGVPKKAIETFFGFMGWRRLCRLCRCKECLRGGRVRAAGGAQKVLMHRVQSAFHVRRARARGFFLTAGLCHIFLECSNNPPLLLSFYPIFSPFQDL